MTNETTQISDREREILRLVATGATNKQIAARLNISINTVKVHLRNIFGKIGAASRTEATLYAVRSGLVSVSEAQTPPQPLVIPIDQAPDAVDDDLDIAISPETAQTVTPLESAPALPLAIQPIQLDAPAPPQAAGPASRRALLIGGAILVVVLLSITLLILLRNQQPAASAETSTPISVAVPNSNMRWRELTAMPKQRSAFALANYNYDGKRFLYVIGGESDTGVSDQVIRYDVENNTWVSLSAKPTPVSDVQSVVIGNKLYVPGGRMASGAISNKLEVYEPQRDRWMALKPLPQPRSAYALVAFEGKLYLFGGWDGTAERADVWQYDPDKDEWTARSAMPTARSFAGAVVIDEAVYIVGGEHQGKQLAVNERYVPADDTSASNNPWTTRAPLPALVSHMATATVGGLVFVVSGADAANRLLIYNSSNDTWQADKAPLEALSDLRAQPVGNKLYVIGGRDKNGGSAQVFEYQALYTLVLPLSP